MTRKIVFVLFISSAVLGLAVLAGCSDLPATVETEAVVPTRASTSTSAPDLSATAEAEDQAALNASMTQNAELMATEAAAQTPTSQALPATATQIPVPTAVPTDEVPGLLAYDSLVHFADVETGLEEIDQIIDIVLAGNLNEFRQRIRFSTLGCTHVMALGGPPKCEEGESEGTPVDVLPIFGPEGHFLRRDEVSAWQGIDVAGLYAVFLVSDGAYSNADYPAGEYGISFRTKNTNTIVTLQVENGRILRIDYRVGFPPEINFERDAAEIILPPPNANQGCPGAALQRVSIDIQASVCTQSSDLIVRSGPGLDGEPLIGIAPGTTFMIIDGPACANNWLWWKIDLESGTEGWVAEGGDDVDPYFICPAE